MRPVLKGLLDGNIVRPYNLSTLILNLHEAGLCQIACSSRTLSELRHSWIQKTGEAEVLSARQTINKKTRRLVELDALLISDYKAQLGGIGPQHTPDKADWYLIATAREAGLDIIVSQDKRFRGKQIKKDFGITVMTADKFLLRIHKHHSVKVARTVSRMLSQTAHDPHRPLFAEAPMFEVKIRRALRMRSL